MINTDKVCKIIDALLITADKPLSLSQLISYFSEEESITRSEIKQALEQLSHLNNNRGFELKKVSSGYRYQSRIELSEWISKHWEEKPPRYSRALLEILSLIIYRQPITRAEIEDIRGVAVSTNIIKTLTERDWVRVIGYKELPGRPAMFGTTRQLLDYFNLASLDDMPSLAKMTDLDKIVLPEALNIIPSQTAN